MRYYGKIHSKLPIFRVKSVKIYTGQKKIYTGMPVAPVTNMRYDDQRHNDNCPIFSQHRWRGAGEEIEGRLPERIKFNFV